eukprot:279418-Chlamydomonas_euryale.AAC.2
MPPPLPPPLRQIPVPPHNHVRTSMLSPSGVMATTPAGSGGGGGNVAIAPQDAPAAAGLRALSEPLQQLADGLAD